MTNCIAALAKAIVPATGVSPRRSGTAFSEPSAAAGCRAKPAWPAPRPARRARPTCPRRGIERAANVFEPEDNIASLMEMMAGLALGRFGAPASLAEQREFFAKHVGPWAGHFFADLEGARASVFYAPVGALGRVFMEIEREAFRLAA